MVVVGTRGHGPVTALLLGSVSHAVVLHAQCTVAVVRPKDTPPAGVVVGVAGDGSDRLPLEFAAGLASAKASSWTRCTRGGPSTASRTRSPPPSGPR